MVERKDREGGGEGLDFGSPESIAPRSPDGDCWGCEVVLWRVGSGLGGRYMITCGLKDVPIALLRQSPAPPQASPRRAR